MRIFLAVLLLSAAAFIVAQAQEVDDLKSIEKSQYGQSILDIVQLQFASNTQNPVEEITKTILAMRKQLNEDQTKEDELHNSKMEDCINSKKQLRKEIRDYQHKISEIKQKRVRVLQEISIFKQDKSSCERVQKSINTYLERVKKLQGEEKKRYEDEVSDLGKQRETLIQARRVLKGEAEGSPSFLEESTSAVQKIKGVFKDSDVKSPLMNRLGDIALFAVQVAASSKGSDSIDSILNMIQTILDAINEHEYLITNVEADKMKAFDRAIKDQETLLTSETTRMASVEAKLTSADNRKRQLSNDLTETERFLKQKRSEVKNRREQCRVDEHAYFQKKKSRVEEFSVIDTIVDYLNERLDNLKDYVSNRKGGQEQSE